MIELDDITGAIVDAAVKIHIDLGPGLLESVYETDIHAESIDTPAAGPYGPISPEIVVWYRDNAFLVPGLTSGT